MPVIVCIDDFEQPNAVWIITRNLHSRITIRKCLDETLRDEEIEYVVIQSYYIWGFPLSTYAKFSENEHF